MGNTEIHLFIAYLHKEYIALTETTNTTHTMFVASLTIRQAPNPEQEKEQKYKNNHLRSYRSRYLGPSVENILSKITRS